MMRFREIILLGMVAFIGIVQIWLGIIVHDQFVQGITTNPGIPFESYYLFQTTPVPPALKDGGNKDLSLTVHIAQQASFKKSEPSLATRQYAAKRKRSKTELTNQTTLLRRSRKDELSDPRRAAAKQIDSKKENETFALQTTIILANSSSPSSSSSIPTSSIKKFLIFHPIKTNQGLGNVISGLLAAHLFGLEFNRTVCVSREYEGFHQAFEALHNVEECKEMESIGEQVTKSWIRIYNYEGAPNEYRLKENLSSDEPVMHHIGNTYPRWPVVPDDFFRRFYKPRKALLDTLPWKEPPRVVVHLRQPDGKVDLRKGLDNLTLHTLGRDLPNHTFLVTNRVDWYAFFEYYGWSYPPWATVRHSAHTRLDWGSVKNVSTHSTSPEEEQSQQNMQMWSDWYTILVADKVYHTHSDFSMSAIHWNNVWSRTIQGSHKVNGGSAVLDLDKEYWVGAEYPRLIDRKVTNLNLPVGNGDEAALLWALSKARAKRMQGKHSAVGSTQRSLRKANVETRERARKWT
jgi:hypothetical protein